MMLITTPMPYHLTPRHTLLSSGIIRALTLLALLTAPWSTLQAQMNVHLDRYSIDEGETVLLTVEVDQRATQRPDFSPLTRDFHFLGSKQMTVSSHANGANQYSTRWRILLRPRGIGEFQIPSLQLNNESSQPLLLTVNGDQSAVAELSRDAFVESFVDTNETYVDSQVLYSQRLYFLKSLPPMATFSEPRPQNTRIIPLGEPQNYTRQHQGQTYQVIEKNYALFPQTPGRMTLEPAIFSAGPGTEELSSAPLILDILPRANQAIKGYWLPASHLQLSDDIEISAPLPLGQSLTRTLSVTAEGIPADQLPALMPLRNELASIEIVDVQTNEQLTGKGLVSSRTEVISITPTERGEVTLPAITIPWWNVTRDQSEKAQLPAVIIRVEPARPIPAEMQPSPAQAGAAKAASISDEASPSDLTEDEDSHASLPLLIWLLAGLAAISSVGWLYSYATLKRQQHPIDKDDESAESAADTSMIKPLVNSDDAMLAQLAETEKRSFEAVLQACNHDRPLEARLQMLEWARLFWPQNEFNHSLDLSDMLNSKTLELLLIDMENYISGTEPGNWSGDLLAQALDRIRRRQLG